MDRAGMPRRRNQAVLLHTHLGSSGGSHPQFVHGNPYYRLLLAGRLGSGTYGVRGRTSGDERRELHGEQVFEAEVHGSRDER
jgi:hypothetical protein